MVFPEFRACRIAACEAVGACSGISRRDGPGPAGYGSALADHHARVRVGGGQAAGRKRAAGADHDLRARGADYADLITDSAAIGFLPKMELSAAGVRRIVGTN